MSPSGNADARIRLSVNLYGGPAMKLKEFRAGEKRLIGVSLTVVLPSGQNDPARAINIGTNRWAFKPEIGFTRRWQRCVVEGYLGLWLFSQNTMFYPGRSTRTQALMPAFEGHIGYYVKPGLWASFDGNFWAGGRTTVNGTVSIPLSRHQSVKLSYSRGAFKRVGRKLSNYFCRMAVFLDWAAEIARRHLDL